MYYLVTSPSADPVPSASPAAAAFLALVTAPPP